MTELESSEPHASRAVKALVAMQLLAVLAGALSFLFLSPSTARAQPGSLPLVEAIVWLLALGTGLWSANALLQGRIGVVELIYIDAAVLATACAALSLVEAHRVFKPLPMLLALAWVSRAWALGRLPKVSAWVLLLALASSLLGDVFLMLPDPYFLPGLLSFLLAHLAYLVLFRRGQAWFPNRAALALTLLLGIAVYGALWRHGLPAALRGPVAGYVLVITCMAAQALGRTASRQTSGSVLVGAGAVFFMASDSLLAFNKFVTPLPLAPLWVLSSYFLAQWLIVRGWLREPE
ncbi:lysoplasmalogenase [Hylemonella sp. W303a]|uniref:lysoplasmalogenase n=1 Tax=Hylemonella sp. W303a TaxID=3389873 RepID=UPI00396B0DE5